MNNNDKEFTIREQFAIRVLILMFRLAKPFKYDHELDKWVAELENSLRGEAKK